MLWEQIIGKHTGKSEKAPSGRTLRAKPGSSALGIKRKPITEIKASLAYRMCSRLVRATLQTLPQSKGKTSHYGVQHKGSLDKDKETGESRESSNANTSSQVRERCHKADGFL